MGGVGRAACDTGEAVGEMQRGRERELDEEQVMYDDTQPVAGAEHECPPEWTEGLEEIKEVALTASADGCPDLTSDCAAVVSFIQEPPVRPCGTTPLEREPDLTAELHVSDEGTDAPAETDTHPSARYSETLLGFDWDAGSEGPFVASHPVFDLRALLADSSCVQTQAEPAGWHFPAGVGLSDVYFCPYVQFPSVSYYPVFQDNNNIEGEIIRHFHSRRMVTSRRCYFLFSSDVEVMGGPA